MGVLRQFRRRGKARRLGRGRLPPIWDDYIARRRLYPPAEVRIMIWVGLILGLLAYQALRLVPNHQPTEPAPFVGEPADFFAEARRSKALLEAQAGAPPPVTAATGDRRGGIAAQAGGVHVVDGDTFDVAGIRVRIADVDTPEVAGRCAFETRLAARATDRIRQLLQSGPFELHPIAGRDEDRYGRKLRIVTRNGRSLGDQLVAEGLARTWSGRREPWC
ncbi:MAG: thermonuclease family protein [Allosphingosinicella sp.]